MIFFFCDFYIFIDNWINLFFGILKDIFFVVLFNINIKKISLVVNFIKKLFVLIIGKKKVVIFIIVY